MTSSTEKNIKSKIFLPFCSDKYRFGFNGKEKDDEITGSIGSSTPSGSTESSNSGSSSSSSNSTNRKPNVPSY